MTKRHAEHNVNCKLCKTSRTGRMFASGQRKFSSVPLMPFWKLTWNLRLDKLWNNGQKKRSLSNLLSIVKTFLIINDKSVEINK